MSWPGIGPTIESGKPSVITTTLHHLMFEFSDNNNNNNNNNSTPGAAADQAAQRKISKYASLASTHIFCPIATETAGTWNAMAIELVHEIGRRITVITEDSRETTFLFQRLSIALQQGNAVSCQNTMTTE